MTHIHNSDLAVITQHHLSFLGAIQKVEGVEQLYSKLHNCHIDKATKVIEAAMAKQSLQLSSMPWVNVIKAVMDVLNLADSDQDVDELVNCCVRATNVNGCAHIVVIALNYLALVILQQDWTWKGGRGGFSCRQYITA